MHSGIDLPHWSSASGARSEARDSLTILRELADTLRSLPHPHYRVGEIPTNSDLPFQYTEQKHPVIRKQPVEIPPHPTIIAPP